MKLLPALSLCSLFLCTMIPALSPAQPTTQPNQPILDFGLDRYTISAWIKSDGGKGPLFTIGELNGKWRSGSKCIYIGENGRMNIRNNGAGHDSGGPILNDGKWHHIVMPSFHSWHFYIDGKRAFMYILDGVPDPGHRRNPVPGGPGVVFKIGQGVDDYPNDTGRQFSGIIDDLRIYDKQLTQEQIKELYEGKTDFDNTSLIAHWPFEKSVADLSPNKLALNSVGNINYTEGREDGSAIAFSGSSSLWFPLTDRAAGKTGQLITAKREEPIKPKYADTEYGTELVKEVGFQKMLMVKRKTYKSSHFYSDFIDGCSRFGSNICILDLQTGDLKNLFTGKMTEGIFGRVDLAFDAKKIVFGWKAAEREGFRIYESDIDGSNLRQLTFPPADEALRIQKYDLSPYVKFANIFHHQTDDMHPCYLPDGGIMFVSSRCEYGTLCNSDDQLVTTVIYRIDGDGKNMQKLSNSPVSEFTPTLTEDGQVLYTRWEYVDKGQIGVKCLWAVNPDGTGSHEVYGNNVRFPPTFIQGRQIPGEPNLYIVNDTPHWPHSGTGTLILVDTTKDIRSLEPMTYITPYIKVMQEPGYNQFDFETKLWKRDSHGPLYRDPFPLSKELFITSHNEDRTRDAKDPTAYGIYLLDTKANHRRIYRDPETSCWCALPLRPRKRPPIIKMPRNPVTAEKNLAVCSVRDIYQGMENVKRGEVKWIRIMEQLPRPWSARRRWQPACGHTQMAGGGGPLSVKLLHGIVPVEKDGSAHFYVPADRNIYFQALNEDFLELQRERTYVNYRPGETRSCIGCHETPNDTPRSYGTTAIALTKPAVMPQPQPGDSTAARPLHYATDIQPILDAKCISCHGAENPAAELRLTGEHTWLSSTSFAELTRKGYVPGFKEGKDFDGTEYSPAKTIGSYMSPLIKQLKKGCPGQTTKITKAEFVRIATWIDTNGVYHGSYWGRIASAHKEHPNYRPVPTLEQALGTINPYDEWTPDWVYPEKIKQKK